MTKTAIWMKTRMYFMFFFFTIMFIASVALYEARLSNIMYQIKDYHYLTENDKEFLCQKFPDIWCNL